MNGCGEVFLRSFFREDGWLFIIGVGGVGALASRLSAAAFSAGVVRALDWWSCPDAVARAAAAPSICGVDDVGSEESTMQFSRSTLT